MTDTAVSNNRVILDGLWSNNPGIVQLLGLCPLLAVSATLINALGLGLATLLVLTLSNFVVSCIRNVIRPEIRIPVYVLIIALSSSLLLSGCFIFRGKNKCDTCPSFDHHKKKKKKH